MKKLGNSLYPSDWLKVAKKDWHRMKIMLNEEDAEAAGYFLQQSLEKYLKALLCLKRAGSSKKFMNWMLFLTRQSNITQILSPSVTDESVSQDIILLNAIRL